MDVSSYQSIQIEIPESSSASWGSQTGPSSKADNWRRSEAKSGADREQTGAGREHGGAEGSKGEQKGAEASRRGTGQSKEGAERF